MEKVKYTEEQKNYLDKEGLDIILKWFDSIYERLMEWNYKEAVVYIDEYDIFNKTCFVDIKNENHPRFYNIEFPKIEYNLNFHDDLFINLYSNDVFKNELWKKVNKEKFYDVSFVYEERSNNKMIRKILIKKQNVM